MSAIVKWIMSRPVSMEVAADLIKQHVNPAMDECRMNFLYDIGKVAKRRVYYFQVEPFQT